MSWILFTATEEVPTTMEGLLLAATWQVKVPCVLLPFPSPPRTISVVLGVNVLDTAMGDPGVVDNTMLEVSTNE